MLDPFGCGGFPLVSVVLPHLCNRHLLGVFRVWRLHDCENGLNDEFSIESGHPVLVDSLRANLASVCLDARMIDLRDELDLGWLERVVVREVEVYCESATNEWRALRSLNVNVPDHDIVLSWHDFNAINRRTCQVTQLLIRPAQTKTKLG